MHIQSFVHLIEEDLLPNIKLSVESPFDPIIVNNHTKSWRTIGSGNYAGVFEHPSMPNVVVKVYGRNKEEIKNEMSVYKRLGEHESFSSLYAFSDDYLVLKKIEGITLFNAVIKGIAIPESVIKDIDRGLQYAKSRGLNPFDVHGKNVVLHNGKGYIVDISDFYKKGYCSKWKDLKKAYYKIYKPFFLRWHPPVPFIMMELVRKGYRFYKKLKRGNSTCFSSEKSL